MTINNIEYTINIWDTAGQELYRGITTLFFKGSEIIILVYDVCSAKSFDSLEKWYEISEETISNEHIYGIVGNKNDLYLNAKVSENDAEQFAKLKKAKFKLVSAKDNPKEFIDFIEELVMDYKQINKRNRVSIKIEKKVKDKDNNCMCK